MDDGEELQIKIKATKGQTVRDQVGKGLNFEDKNKRMDTSFRSCG